jgi:hypothetical protein
MDSTVEPFLVIVFPAERDKRALADMATRLMSELRKACGSAPTMVRPDATALCLLVDGEFARISAALEAARAPDTRYLLVRVEGPFETCGLSTAHAWLQARVGS